MGEYSIYATPTFKKIYFSLDKKEREWVDKVKENFKENPTGKPLKFSWFREKRYLGKRLYFMVDYEKKKVLFVSFAPKKDQQKIIDFVLMNKEEFLNYIKEI